MILYKPLLKRTIEDIRYLHELTGRSMPECKDVIDNVISEDGTVFTVDVIIEILKRGWHLIDFANKAEKRRYFKARPGWTAICNRLDLDTPDNKEIKVLTPFCNHCGIPQIIYVRSKDYEDYKNHIKRIQDAFPYLSSGEREMFLSGICERCFEMMRREAEEDEYDEENDE